MGLEAKHEFQVKVISAIWRNACCKNQTKKLTQRPLNVITPRQTSSHNAYQSISNHVLEFTCKWHRLLVVAGQFCCQYKMPIDWLVVALCAIPIMMSITESINLIPYLFCLVCCISLGISRAFPAKAFKLILPQNTSTTKSKKICITNNHLQHEICDCIIKV